MRVFEIVSAVSDGRAVVDATGGVLDGLRLPEGSQGSVESTPVGGVVLVAPESAGREALVAVLERLPLGADIVVFLPVNPLGIPVGVVVDALVASGVQAVDAIPVEHAVFGVAVVGARREGWAPVTSYLSGRTPLTPDEAGLRRIVAERVVDGLATRARLDGQGGTEVDQLRAELQKAQADLAATKKRLDGIVSSPSYVLAKRIARIKPGGGKAS
jgi:hypothetical protein